MVIASSLYFELQQPSKQEEKSSESSAALSFIYGYQFMAEIVSFPCKIDNSAENRGVLNSMLREFIMNISGRHKILFVSIALVNSVFLYFGNI